MPALLMRTSRVPTSSTARWICEKLVTSSVRGVTRPSECARGWRVPAYTRFAPLLKASSTSAWPMPRLAPVIKMSLSPIVVMVVQTPTDAGSERREAGIVIDHGDTAGESPDSETFERLVEPYVSELRVHCYRILGSVPDAEDVLQETLMAAWRGLPGFEQRSSLRVWLYRIATNRCLNALRSRARRPEELRSMS